MKRDDRERRTRAIIWAIGFVFLLIAAHSLFAEI